MTLVEIDITTMSDDEPVYLVTAIWEGTPEEQCIPLIDREPLPSEEAQDAD